MDEMCLEMCKITRWERGYRLILDRVDFSVHKKEKVLIRGKIQEDTRQMFQVASGVTAVQEGTYRISRAGYHTGAISGSGADESNRLSAIAVAYARI